MLNCNIIVDLLPAYVDGLTSTETSTEIEEHLEQCEMCRHVCERMRTPLKTPSASERNINFLRKIKRRTWIIVGSTVVAAVLAIAAYTYIINLRVPLRSDEVSLSQTAQYIKPSNIQSLQSAKDEDSYMAGFYSVALETDEGSIIHVSRDGDITNEIFVAAGSEVPEEVLLWQLSMTSLVQGMSLGFCGGNTVLDGKEYHVIEPKKKLFEGAHGDDYITAQYDILTYDYYNQADAVIVRFADQDVVYTYADIFALAESAR